MRLLQALKPEDRPRRKMFVVTMLDKLYSFRSLYEINYRLDVFRATNGAHVEVHNASKKKLEVFLITIKQTQ